MKLKDGRALFDMTLLKFFVVGIINTLLGMGIMMIMYNVFRCSYWVSTASNYVITSTIAFFVNRKITFKSKERSILQGVKFAAHIITCYLIAYGVARPLTTWLLSRTRLSPRMVTNLAMLVGMGLFSTMNYLGQRLLVFRDKNERK